MSRAFRPLAVAGVASFALGACATVATPPVVPTLPGGAITAMSPASNAERSAITASPVRLVGPVTYRPIRNCSYEQVQTTPSGAATTERSTLSIRPVRGRLLVTMTTTAGPSTALIGPDGELFDFNLLGRDGQRRTPRNSAQIMNRTRADNSKIGGPTTHVVDDLTSVFPRYFIRSWAPGDAVANVIDERGQAWATYTYRGTTTYRGTSVAVLDMMRTLDTLPQYGRVVVGFMLVDTMTMSPLLFVMDGGWKTRVERTACASGPS